MAPTAIRYEDTSFKVTDETFTYGNRKRLEKHDRDWVKKMKAGEMYHPWINSRSIRIDDIKSVKAVKKRSFIPGIAAALIIGALFYNPSIGLMDSPSSILILMSAVFIGVYLISVSERLNIESKTGENVVLKGLGIKYYQKIEIALGVAMDSNFASKNPPTVLMKR